MLSNFPKLDVMMLLYHGTSAEAARKAVLEGLLPRGSRASLWSAASNPDSVYLTETYAVHFAAHAAGEGNLGLVEVDTDLVDPESLFADEDALALSWSAGGIDAGDDNALLKSLTVEGRAQYFARRLGQWSAAGADWKWSMSVIGNCTHRGPVPPEAITRVIELRNGGGWWLEWHDPVVSPSNFRFMGGYYRATGLVFAGRTDQARGIDLGLESCDLDAMEASVAPLRTLVFDRSAGSPGSSLMSRQGPGTVL